MMHDGGIPGRIPKAISNDSERRRERSSSAPPPDMRVVIPHAQQGDPNALSVLMGFTQGVVRRGLREFEVDRKGTGVASDIAGEAMEVVARVLPNFDPYLPMPENISDEQAVRLSAIRYSGYVNRIVRTRLIDHIRREGRAANIRYIETPLYENGDGTEALFSTVDLESILTPLQFGSIQLRLSGMGLEAIANVTGFTREAVKLHIIRARKKIEGKILEPRSLFRVASYTTDDMNHRTLNEHSYSGKLQAVKVFQRWYSRQDWFDEYRHFHIDPPDTGYFQISKMGLKKREFRFIQNNNGRPELGVLIRDGKMYANPGVIRGFLDREFTPRLSSEKQVFPNP